MVSRYDRMSASVTEIDTSGESWPDPLSVNWGKFEFKTPATIVPVDERFQKRFYLITAAMYKEDLKTTIMSYSYYDDIILNINNVPHIQFIFDYDPMKFPVIADLTYFMGLGRGSS